MPWLCAPPAVALESDRDKPMDVAADRFEGEHNGGVTTLLGNVRITQGTLQVVSDKAVVHQDAGEVERARLEGAPATLQQDLDKGGRVNASARTIDYDLATGTVVLTGDVVIVQPQGELRGERVTYELTTGKMTGSGAGAGSRVRLHIPPKGKSEPAARAD
jgi:lipopolysaccharide export system protein LptA